ncbi:MAG: alpha/beta hydrolase [Rhodothermales bacterium]
MEEHRLVVSRTARYFTLPPEGEVREVWFALHGYGQLASFFIRHFRAVQDGHCLVVAPEALSRFYLEDHQRVGASWMTREDRLTEIDDYLAYLDALYDHFFEDIDRESVAVHVLGFSQGAATASRWTTRGRMDADRLILWAGDLAHDIDLDARAATLRRLDLTLVVGSEDALITPERLAGVEALLARHDIPYRLLRFDGSHRMDAAVLQTLAMPHIDPSARIAEP